MPTDIRNYLLDRFTSDASTLRKRAAAYDPKAPGPDAATSLRMAVACEDVVRSLAALPVHGTVDDLLVAMQPLAASLDERAANAAKDQLVRSVYAGAATRIREVIAKEKQAESGDDADDRDDEDEDE